jgi:hypothetical protein
MVEAGWVFKFAELCVAMTLVDGSVRCAAEQ